MRGWGGGVLGGWGGVGCFGRVGWGGVFWEGGAGAGSFDEPDHV